MPIHKTTKKGKPAEQWGSHGKKYTGPNAKAKAAKQAAAAHANGFKGDKKKSKVKNKKPIALDAMSLFRAEHTAKKSQAEEVLRAKTVDGFDNFISRIGLRNDNTLSASTYTFNLLTRNRIRLEAAYRGSWIVGVVVDSIAEDMTRAGIDINTAKGEGDIKKITAAMSRLQVWQSFKRVISLGRLYGGSLGIIQIKGQDLSTPLDVTTIRKGQFQGIVPFDRWMLNPIIQEPIDSGPDMGLPSQYQIVNDPDEMSPNYSMAPQAIQNQYVHFSRCIRYTGIDLPYFQAITEMMWGESILERLWDRLIAFDNASMSAASLIDRANLRTVQIDKLREVLAAGAEATAGLYAQFEMMRELQVNEGITLLDKEDTFSSTAYSFAGLSDMLMQFGQQLAGASGVPLVRLFGQSPAGMNATGESDMRIYYDNILASQEARLRNPVEVILKVLWASELGTQAPDDMEFSFKPLWQMSALDKANIAKLTTETIVGAYDSGVTERETTLMELRDASSETGVFSNITDEQIKEAEEEEPPLPDENPDAVDPEVKPKDKPVPAFT